MLFQLLDQPVDVSPNIYLYVGTKDHHYKNHVMPLYEQLQHKKYKVTLDVEQNITHDGLKTYFPHYLKKTASHILNIPFDDVMPPIIKRITFEQKDQRLVVNCEASGQGLEYAYCVYQDGQILEKLFYTGSMKFRISSDKTRCLLLSDICPRLEATKDGEMQILLRYKKLRAFNGYGVLCYLIYFILFRYSHKQRQGLVRIYRFFSADNIFYLVV